MLESVEGGEVKVFVAALRACFWLRGALYYSHIAPHSHFTILRVGRQPASERGTSLIRNNPPEDPTVALCLGQAQIPTWAGIRRTPERELPRRRTALKLCISKDDGAD